MKYIFSLFALFLLIAGIVNAQNWPQFRGPNGQGHSAETNLPLKWSATENIAWKTELPGESWSSPIVWGNRVFVTTATDGGTSCRVLALDRKTGKIVWNKEVFQQTIRRKEGRNSYATPTPATDGKLVYACFGDGSFAALDFNGRTLWTNRDYPFYGQHGLGTALLLHDELLLMARDGSSDGEDKKLGWQTPWDKAYIVALEAKTGKERWKAKRGLSRISHGTPTIWKAPNGRAQIVSEAGDVLQGFDPKTGARLWTSEVIGEGKVPSVVIGDGMAFTSGGWGGKESIKAFKLGGAGDLKETNLVWEQKKGMPKVPSMIYVKPYLFAITDGGVATCMNAATGELLWQQRVGGNFSASPVAAEGRVYFVGDNGETTVIKAGTEFEVLAKNSLDETVQASPAIAQGQLLIRTQKHLFAIGSNGAVKPSANGLVAAWNFDETKGDQAKDASGHNHHGRLRGAKRAAGKFGGAIACTQDALVEVPHAPALDEFKQGLTVAAWVNRTADSTWNTIISREIKDGWSEYFGLAVVKNKALFSVDGDGAHYQNIKSDEDMPVGEWIHLAGTYDNATFKLYVNGRLVKSVPYSIPFTFSDTNPLIIGGNTNTQGKQWLDCFHGRIDDVRMFNRGLSEKEVAVLFAAASRKP